ncbi:adenylate/guanylate cyclase domain-containing protein [Aeromicrobium sp. CF3.5]|uniref:adenylate/guanylate cyclase domain-containing protein n=1 Tax=Aeromicrobium sp. CF3.5 TaxID=3373078 RepID=UPI003EE6BF2C
MSQSDLRGELIRLLLGADVALTAQEVTERGGLSLEDGQRLWRALGFPDRGDGVAYTDADTKAVAAVAAALTSDLFEEATVFRMTRALGTTMSRLADWQVSTLVEQVEHDIETGAATSRLERAVDLAQYGGSGFEMLLLYAWRRHLAAAVARMDALGASDEELLSTDLTVGFADLSRFTSLSNGLDDSALGHLVEDFESRCTDIVTARGGRIVKTLGDAVLFVADTPTSGTQIAMELVGQIARRPDIPDVKVGLATGSVLSRLGDVFGPPVNLAARLTSVARSNRVLVDQHTADGLGDEFETRVLPPRPLRGFGNVSPVTVSRRHGFRAR